MYLNKISIALHKRNYIDIDLWNNFCYEYIIITLQNYILGLILLTIMNFNTNKTEHFNLNKTRTNNKLHWTNYRRDFITQNSITKNCSDLILFKIKYLISFDYIKYTLLTYEI